MGAAMACRVDSRGLGRGGSVDVGAASFGPQVGRGAVVGQAGVLGAVVGQAGVSRRVSGRGMGLQGAGVAPYFLVSYFSLASRIIFAKKSSAPRFALLERSCCT